MLETEQQKAEQQKPEPGDLYFDEENQRVISVLRVVGNSPFENGWLVHAQPLDGTPFETTLAPHYWRRVGRKNDLH